MFDEYRHEARVTVGRQYVFGKGWKWKVKIGRRKEKGTADTEREAELAAAFAKYRMGVEKL